MGMDIELALQKHDIDHLLQRATVLIDRIGHATLNITYLLYRQPTDTHAVFGEAKSVKVTYQSGLDAVAATRETLVRNLAAAVPLCAQLAVAQIIVYIVAILYYPVLHVKIRMTRLGIGPQGFLRHRHHMVVGLHLAAH